MREIPTGTKSRITGKKTPRGAGTCLNGRPCRERADRSRDDRRYLMRRRWPHRPPGPGGQGVRVRVAVGREQSSFSAVPLVSNVHSYRILLNLESDM